MRRAVKCQCTDKNCTRWYVDPEAGQEDIGEFTEEQAKQVANFLDVMDREENNVSAIDTFTTDAMDALEKVMSDYLSVRGKVDGIISPNNIIPVRADVIGSAYTEIKSLRKKLVAAESKFS